MKCQIQPFVCKFCQVNSSSFDSHQRHRRGHLKKYVPASAKTGNRLRKPVRKFHQAQAYHCRKQFHQVSNLGEYIKSHPASDDNSYQCHLCQECFAGIALLEEHVRTHDFNGPSTSLYPCEYCSKSFDESGEFLEHIKSHNSLRERYQCTYCPKCTEHVEEKEKLYPCNYCKKSFVQYSSRNRHVKLKHTKSRNYEQKLHQCTHCQKCFPDKTDLRSHVRRMHKMQKQPEKHLAQVKRHTAAVKTFNVATKQNQCIHCKKSFAYRSTLNRHLQENICTGKNKSDNSTKITAVTITSTKGKRYQCTQCQKSFTRKHTAEQRHHCTTKKRETLEHITSDNSARTAKVTMSLKANRYQCSDCQKSFTRKHTLEQHFQRHRCTTNKKGTVDIKSDNSTRTTTRRTCMMKKAGEKKMTPYHCQHYPKVFTSSSSHSCHVRLVHTGTKKYNKPYKCKICNNSFSSNFTLKEHLRVHTGGEISQYQCKYCQNTFKQSSSLKRHFRLKHAVNSIKQKPYQCRHCHKCFADSSVWKRHVRMHVLENQPGDHSKSQTSQVPVMSNTEAKQHQCILCKKSFSTYSTLKRHLQGNCCAAAQKKEVLDLKHIKSNNSTETTMAAVSAKANQHQCRHCQKSFTGRYPLDQHLKRNDCTTQEKDIRSYTFTRTPTVTMSAKANQHQCTHCQKMYTRRHTLEQHLIGQKCAGNKKIPLQCNYCQKTFAHSFIYNQHVKTHTNTTENEKVLYECQYCEKTFTQAGSRSRHITLYHLTKKELTLRQCKQCLKSFSDSTTFTEHVGTCKSEELNKCGYCSESFVHSKDLASHITASHADQKDVIEEKTHNCVHCHQSFLQRDSLIQHLKTKVCVKELFSHTTATHTKKKDVIEGKPHKCVHCHQIFLQRDSLIQHLKSKVCVKNLTDVSVSKDHVEEHRSKFEESYNYTQSVEPRKSYEDTPHIKSSPFIGTSSSATVAKVTPFQFKCDYCQKYFSLKGSLTRHVATHHSSKQCQQCQESFANLKLLKQHMETRCTKKQHQCWQCGESFSNRFVLNMHVKTHSDVQVESKYPKGKYQCGYCLQSFDHITGLGEHMKSHTSMEFVP